MREVGTEGGLEVLADTMVATWAWFAGSRKSPAAKKALEAFGEQLTGRTLVICGQTRAELLRLKMTRSLTAAQDQAFMDQLDAIPYLPLDGAVQLRYAELSIWGHKHAHPISQPSHAADRWIAASALEFGLPVASIDKSFVDIPLILCLRPQEI